MKVYSTPKEVPDPKMDYVNFDMAKYEAALQAHGKALEAWLRKAGYTGKRTGMIVRFPMADGYAEYMLAEGKKSCLIHLPYGDAYDNPDVRFVPKAEILKRIEAQDKMRALFSKKGD